MRRIIRPSLGLGLALGGGGPPGATFPFPSLGYLPPELVADGFQTAVFSGALSPTQFPTTVAQANTMLGTAGASVSLRDLVVVGEETLVISASSTRVLVGTSTTFPTLTVEIATALEYFTMLASGGKLTVKAIRFRLPGYFDDELGQPVYLPALRSRNFHFVHVEAINPVESAAVIYGQRIQFSNCRLEGADYGAFVGAAGTVRNEDITFANCTIIGDNEASVRILQTDRTVCVASVLGEIGVSNKHGYRLHQGTTMAYCARNTLAPGGLMLTDPAEPGETLGRFWFEDNDVVYGLANGVIITLDPYVRISEGTIRNNTFTGTGETTFAAIWPYGAAPGDWDLTGNVVS